MRSSDFSRYLSRLFLYISYRVAVWAVERRLAGVSSSNQVSAGSKQGGFAATRWSVVLAAAGPTDSQAQRALAELCQNYWYPLYAFVRRSGYAAEDAQDLTQEFFARLLEKNYLTQADPQRGRFRTFLLTTLKHFLINEWNRTHAQKRGGGRTVVQIEALDAERRYGVVPADEMSPDRLFDRQWAMTVLDQAITTLRREYADVRKAALFEALKDVLTGQAESSYARLAKELSTSEAAIKMALHRLRRRYRAVLRQQIAQTVASPDQIEEEVNELLKSL